jgi:hypothetical protein
VEFLFKSITKQSIGKSKTMIAAGLQRATSNAMGKPVKVLT